MDYLKFCDKCGKILEIKLIDQKNIGLCGCGFTKEFDAILSYSEKLIKKQDTGSGVYQEPETIGFPHTCEKCGYNLCDIYDIKAGYSDESDIILLRCKKCKYVERQADGSSNN